MRLWLLYLRSRLVFEALAGLLILAGLCWIVGQRWGQQDDLFLITVVTVPLAASVTICATTGSPFGDVEGSGSRPLTSLRFGHLAGLLSIAALALTGAATAWPGVDVEWWFARNLLGLTGLGLLFVRILGGRLAWLPPLALVIAALFQSDAATDTAPVWAWVVQPTSRDTSIIALLLLFAGLTLATRFGARDVDETVTT